MSANATIKDCGNLDCNKSVNATKLLVCTRCRNEAYCSKECQVASWGAHKPACKRQNYIVKIQCQPDKIKNPTVMRVLSCPSEASFYDFHLALQTAFGWATTHSFDFAVMNPDFKDVDSEDAAKRRLIGQNMMRADPKVRGIPADKLWSQEYLFRATDPTPMRRFLNIDRTHESGRRHPNTVEKRADRHKLYQLFDNEKYKGCQITYTYDLGDNWDHFLKVTGRAPATDTFVCLDGTGHPIAEDCASHSGWNDLKAAYGLLRPDPRLTFMHLTAKRRWFETECSNGDARGLSGDRINAWDKDQVNRELLHLRERFAALAAEPEGSRRRKDTPCPYYDVNNPVPGGASVVTL